MNHSSGVGVVQCETIRRTAAATNLSDQSLERIRDRTTSLRELHDQGARAANREPSDQKKNEADAEYVV